MVPGPSTNIGHWLYQIRQYVFSFILRGKGGLGERKREYKEKVEILRGTRGKMDKVENKINDKNTKQE